ncbi:MAG: xanthine dehydrogenase family protein molybdopterin-binding subunit [Betaproteobacteria bacterium]
MNELTSRHVGKRVRRVEDPALLRGAGRFVGDIEPPGTLHAAFVRSPYAHALINAIDVAAAAEMPGVIAVLTAVDLAKVLTTLRMPLGFPTTTLPPDITPFVLTPEEVCYVGEAVAMVLATSRYTAEDGAGAVLVDYEPLPVLADCRDALVAGSPKVRREAVDNVLCQFKVGYGDCEGVLATAPHVFKERLHQHRGGAHPIEGRGVVASFDRQEGTLSVWSSTQMAHELQFTVAEMLGIQEQSVRVVAPDVGGGFGAKFLVYPEEIAIAAASRLHGCTVKWIEDRAEHFVSAIQERDQHWDVEIGVDDDGMILGVRGRMIHDQGAYTPQGINCAYNAATAVTGPYVVPNYELDVYVAQTNKVFTIPVRGAGYPEGTFVMERLLDRVARELQIDRALLRTRNLIPADQMPYVKPLKNRAGHPITLDSGDYLACQSKVLEVIDYAGFAARKALAREQGRHIGIGLAHGIKGTGRGPFESASVKIAPSGRITVSTGAMAMGQGLETALAQIAAEALGASIESIDVVSGDTAAISMGIGGFASRQTITAGSSVLLAARAVSDKALKVASQMLEVAASDLVLRDGKVEVQGIPEMSVPLGKIARLLRGIPGYDLPDGVGAGLEATIHWEPDAMAYANTFHACEVEVDVETGGVHLLRYVAMQDCGRLVNPLIVEGQIHGGIVHGIGNALFEYMRYDENAQPLSTTFADYLLPTSTEIPPLELLFMESPTTSNPLGVKGVGEVGTLPVTSAIASAVDDALSEYGVRIAAVPIDPVRIVEQIEGRQYR